MAIFFVSLIARLKNSQLTTTGIVNVFETSLTDSRIQADHQHITAEDIQVHGRVEFEAKTTISLELSQKELDRINVDFLLNMVKSIVGTETDMTALREVVKVKP